VLTGPDVE